MLTAYLAERMSPERIVPVAAVVGLAAWAGTTGGASRLSVNVALALLLIVQFRAWDDLADRTRDTAAHPDRVLVRAASVAPLLVFTILLGAMNFVASAARENPRSAVMALLGLNMLMATYYRLRGERTSVSDHVLLAKYPLFVLAIAAGDGLSGGRVLAPMAIVYLGACLYEAWHDPGSPAAANRLLVASEAVLLIALAIVLSIGGHS